MYKAYQKEQMFKRAEKRLVSLIKAELTNRKTAAIKEKCAKLERKTAKANALVNETMGQVTKSQQEAEALLAEHEAFVADASRRIDKMTAVMEAANRRSVSQKSAKPLPNSPDWTRSKPTGDSRQAKPAIRPCAPVYMAKAEGRDIDDD